MSTSANNTRSVICPPFKIETRISFVDREHNIEVPLGNSYAGQWHPYQFLETEESLVLTIEQLVNWLTESDWFGIPLIDVEEEARSVIEETIQRCQALVEDAKKG